MRSEAGRTRTAPARGSGPAQLRVAVASCQQSEHGYYAPRHMLEDDLDQVVHVGDYIYERSWGSSLVRQHGAPECYTLGDCRARYALYRMDRDLQGAHAAYPWMVTWNDHEVDNDYANDTSEENDDPALFLAGRPPTRLIASTFRFRGVRCRPDRICGCIAPRRSAESSTC